MPQKKQKITPRFFTTDIAYSALKQNESPFIKDIGWDINANKNIQSGTSNPSEEGQNLLTLTPTRSNIELPDVLKPDGFNKNGGSFLSPVTNETYYFNVNDRGDHGIYVIDGDTFGWTKIIIDPQLGFSFEQDGYISEHRVSLRLVKNAEGDVVEKFLMWTDGRKWQGWVSVNAAIATNGFDVSQYPYWALQPPHFDRRELLEFPVRPPMVAPRVVPIPNTLADKGKTNRLLNTAFEICYQNENTDGRETTVSPYSVPLIIKSEDFLSNPDSITKRVNLILSAGSSLTEKVNIYFRFIERPKDNSLSLATWTPWYLYDTIYKYGNTLTNTNAVLGTPYWLRTNPWAAYSYDPVFNTITYVFDNSKLGQPVAQELFNMIQNAIPQLSVGMTSVGDAILFANNRSGYDNLSEKVTNKFSLSLKESDNAICPIPTRKVTMYAYIGNQEEDDSYLSQVGYFYGADLQMRFGGVGYSDATPDVAVRITDSRYFKLDFADRSAFRLYFKGTPYFADGAWYQVNPDNSLQKLSSPLDLAKLSDATLVKNILDSGAYFVCVFEAELPAGRYIATLGRHNVASTGDYINTSTYIMGIANSRVKSQSLPDFPQLVSIKPNAIVSTSKEIEIDCTAGDVNVWGNNADLFYVYCPHVSRGSIAKFRFTEGYIQESPDRKIGFELLPYQMTGISGADAYGVNTDKNGFYFAYTKAANSADREISFNFRRNCTYPANFIIYSSAGIGWKENGVAYFSSYNNNTVGFANYVVYKARITDLTGAIGYSDIAISITDGGTVYTDSNGEASLIIHNGRNFDRIGNVYINAGGDFLISILNCGYLPITFYSEGFIACSTTAERVYPFPLNQGVIASASEQKSVKSNSTKVVSLVVADLAGRVSFVNKINEVDIPSFPQAGKVSAIQLAWALNGALQLNSEDSTRDFAWAAFYVSVSTNYERYLQWVGDKIEFIDSNGNVTNIASSASLIRVTIQSLLNTNIKNNFTLFSNYQFVRGDKLRVLDDGKGQLLNTSVFGDMIDVDIQGSNYNQAAINARLIIPPANTVLTDTTTTDATVLYVKYDARWNKLKDATGFWIELYTPTQDNEKLPYYEVESFYPIINGEIAIYAGGGVSNPIYTFPTSGTLNFWDTYFIRRSINILNSGNKFFNHPFESPNITDTWGYNAISGGRQNTINPEAKQLWHEDQTIRSNNYVSNGIVNGLGTFLSENIKYFRGYGRGGITGIISQHNLFLFICENNYFTVDYNQIYTKVQGNNIVAVNLNDNLGEPHQKIGDVYGCAYDDTQTISFNESIVGWYDRKNQGYILCNYGSAKDITRIKDDKTGMIESYFTKKSQLVTSWNQVHDVMDKFDIISGIDISLNKIYVTFRPRRDNSTLMSSFVNTRRNLAQLHQETFVYDLATDRWVMTTAQTPESYSKIRGNTSGEQMLVFAKGAPYYTRTYDDTTFANFFGIQTQPCFIGVFNADKDSLDTIQNITENCNDTVMFVDNIFGTDMNSFSWLPSNLIVKKERTYYGDFRRNAVTYPPVGVDLLYQSMWLDGKRIWGDYFVCRFVVGWAKTADYFQMDDIEYEFFNDEDPAQ